MFRIELMEKAVFFESTYKRGSKILQRDGYFFRICKRTPTKTYWRCFSQKCKAALALDINDYFILSSNGVDHNHATNPDVLEVKKFYEKIRQNVVDNPTSTIPQIYRETLTDMYDSSKKVPSLIPKFDGIRCYMYKVRAGTTTHPKTTAKSKSGVSKNSDRSDSPMIDEGAEPNQELKNQAEGRTENRRVPCETPNEPGPSNTRNEQDSNSSDSINKEDTENRPDDDTAVIVKKVYKGKRYRASGSGHLRLSAPRKKNRGENFSQYNRSRRLKKQEAAAGTSSSPTEESSTGPSDAKPQYELKEKRRFVNVAFFVKSLKDLNTHGGDGCTFSDMNICGETKNGWNAGIKLSCSVCLTTVIVWMDDPAAKLMNSQPPASSTSAGTAKEKQLTAEEIPTKKHRINNQGTPMQSADSRVQQETMVPPADPLVHLQTMVPPADPLVQLQSLTTNINVPPTLATNVNVIPTLARPFGPQSNPSSNQGWRYNPLHSIHPQNVVPPPLGRQFLGSQSNSPHQNRMLNPSHMGNPHFMVPPQLASPLVPQSNSPHQGWRHNSLHVMNQFIMQPQITRPFVPQSDSSPHQYWTYNPSHSSNPHFVVPPPLARPFLIPQSNTVHQEGTDNPPQSINPHSINQATFVKQELVSPEDAAGSSINKMSTLSTQPVCMQLLFCVEPSENSNTMPRSANESTTSTPNDETLTTNRQTSSTTVVESSQNLANSEIIVPEMPTEVLPVDLNLVKDEIEDESQSMEFSVRLVPHSETSLNHSESPFASELSIKAKIVTDSPLVKIESVIPSTIEATESGAKPFSPVSDSLDALDAKDSTVSSYPTSPQTVFQQVISCSKEDLLRQTANDERDNNVLNVADKTNVNL